MQSRPTAPAATVVDGQVIVDGQVLACAKRDVTDGGPRAAGVPRRSAVLVGGSVAGLATALGLARAGLDVVVLERDRLPDGQDPDQAFTAARSGVPQIRHAHQFRARARATLAHHAPDVLDRLLDAGAWVTQLDDKLPATIADRGPRDGDDELAVLECRRTTFEGALRDAVRRQPGIELHDGVTVAGLLATCGPRNVPLVTGVEDSSGRRYTADVVIDASGRHTPQRWWLADLGVTQPPDHVQPCGIMYLSRAYRLHPGQPRRVNASGGQGFGDRDGLGWGIVLGDADSFSVTMTVPTGDRSLLRVRHPAGFDAVADQIPGLAAWVHPDRCRPASDPMVMGGLVNRRRSLVDEHGDPLVLGLHAVGDAVAHTNPAYARGCSLALVHAFGLADVIADHPEPHEQARGAQALVAREIDPWYWYSVAEDQAAATAAQAPKPRDRQPIRGGLLAAMQHDADTYRSVMRIRELLDPLTAADAIESSPAITTYDDVPAALPAPAPEREQIVAMLDRVAA